MSETKTEKSITCTSETTVEYVQTYTSEITVEYVQHIGTDETIAHAARISARGIGLPTVTKEKVEGLLNYLMSSRHGSPFEHGCLTVRVHAPIKVFREWHRHRVGWSYNEESGRYKDLDPVFYLPPPARPMIRPPGFKSAHPNFEVADEEQYLQILSYLTDGYAHAYAHYLRLLAMGVDRGLARDVLGVGLYSSMYATANPRSLMHFLELRTCVPTAKRPSMPLYEIEVAATKLEGIFAGLWPVTYKAWVENGRMAP